MESVAVYGDHLWVGPVAVFSATVRSWSVWRPSMSVVLVRELRRFVARVRQNHVIVFRYWPYWQRPSASPTFGLPISVGRYRSSR